MTSSAPEQQTIDSMLWPVIIASYALAALSSFAPDPFYVTTLLWCGVTIWLFWRFGWNAWPVLLGAPLLLGELLGDLLVIGQCLIFGRCVWIPG